MSRLRITASPSYPCAAPLLRSIAAEGLPAGSVCIYPGRRNQLYVIPTPQGEMVIKCFGLPNAVNSVAYATLRRSKACRSYLNSLRLMELGISVPAPVAYAEERSGVRLLRSWYVSLPVEGETLRFYECRPDCDALLDALAVEMLRMHLLGVWHKDFSPGNIIVGGDAERGYTFDYVDLNRMGFGVFSHEKQMRMFERINYTELHTLRLARAYARVLEGNPVRLAGLFPLLRRDALLFRGEEYIVEEARRLFREFWHRRARKKRMLRRRR